MKMLSFSSVFRFGMRIAAKKTAPEFDLPGKESIVSAESEGLFPAKEEKTAKIFSKMNQAADQLKSAGLIESRRDGKEVFYRAAATETARLLHRVIEQTMSIVCPLE